MNLFRTKSHDLISRTIKYFYGILYNTCTNLKTPVEEIVYEEPSYHEETSRPKSKSEANATGGREITVYSDYENDDYKSEQEEEIELEECLAYGELPASENQVPSRPKRKTETNTPGVYEVIDCSDYENDDYKPEEEIDLEKCLAYGKLPTR